MESVERPAGPAWFGAQAEREAKRDVLKSSDRFGQLVAAAGCIVVIAFVAIHQTEPTGFFVGDSGTVAATIIYVMLAVGTVPIIVRFITGRNNRARPFEAIGMVFFFVGQLYLLAEFPFDFSHFADPLPKSLEFLLDWISATLAKWILGIGIVGGVLFSVYDVFLYRAVKERLAKIEASSSKTIE